MRALDPPSAFEALDANHRLRYWTAKLADDDPHQHVAIAEIGSQVVGIGAVADRPIQSSDHGRRSRTSTSCRTTRGKVLARAF